ncbi:hypothetical protein I312_103608 [Cryptococcus bacillisporus CA1280]|uniref:Methyltransferase type 11 domain-containing protein n=1 Tax=Cryptococcus bacillisporus CA1280 TaxID=1296109 RepID=A0A0D0VL03_CRYGA|nr:hypothetical protein I312_03418 [Cryptococcus bacillisporus CA1280]
MATTDFWSPSYWQTRFSTESNFEWLLPSSTIIPLVHEILLSLPSSPTSLVQKVGQKGDAQEAERKVTILHVGCGSSTLGTQLQAYLDDRPQSPNYAGGRRVYQVYDADYVKPPVSIMPAEQEGKVPFKLVDVLSTESLLSNLPYQEGPVPSDDTAIVIEEEQKWDFVLDKSTCDAISTGPQLFPFALSAGQTEQPPVDPVERTVFNLSKVVKKGGKWVSISYSPIRYDFLSDFDNDGNYGWKVVRKEMVAMTSIPEGRRIREGNQERIVYEPETGVWMYVLERV